MNIQNLILSKIEENGTVNAAEVVKESGFSRAFVHKFFQELRESGKIVMLGKANKAVYVKSSAAALNQFRTGNLSFNRIFVNSSLYEDEVLKIIQQETAIFEDIPKNVKEIVEYAFTEMLNNAIEHSQTANIQVSIMRDDSNVSFEVNDRGVGIFNNIRQKENLKTDLEAIEDLLKGKQTTDPSSHSGEGIFFTSKVADFLVIKSGGKKLFFDSIKQDVFLQNSRVKVGTKIKFTLDRNSVRTLHQVFTSFTGAQDMEFSKTRMTVKMNSGGSSNVSRSQARRMLHNLNKFKDVVLDFDGVEYIGQGYADEVFRVWSMNNPGTKVMYENANENVKFMIERAKRNSV